MSIEPIKNEVRALLAQTNYDIRRAERELTDGDSTTRIRASGELVNLRRHKTEFEDRMCDLNRSSDGFISTVVQWFKESWMLIIQSLERGVEGR
jgi:hypothetical protein